MGLGKTVELLACIFAHRKSMSEGIPISEISTQKVEGQKNGLKRSKIERIECICGALSESPKYKGIWVQCDVCDAWQHADCVGYSPKGKCSVSQEVSKEKGRRKVQSGKYQKRSNKKNSSNIVEMDGNHICQLCSELIQASQSPVDTGATLIVCPSPILHQWHAEIMRHTRPGSLKTCIYEGVKNASLSVTPTVDISELVSADIVLTTYDVLKEDLSHDSDRNDGDRRSMRFNKRYPVIPTLLTRLYFWRVCLDEAQMVESNTAAATEMALRLHAKYHWCITGTPIQRRFDDMYGLLKFLGASPFEVRRWWLEVIKDPYERGDVGAMEFAHKFFKQIMWRSLKAHVRDELQLPTQEHCVCWLSFSPIEAYFYQKQHETCLNYAHEVIKSYKEDIHKKKFNGSQSYDSSSDIILTYAEAAKLLHSLLKLRQACCHPQVGSSGLRSIQRHSPMTMEEILGVLVSKSKIEGEDALRSTVSSLNGLAGIAMIEGDPSRAVSLYREALTLAEEHSTDFKLDPLLYYHIHHNLAEIVTPSNLSQIQPMKWELPESTETMPSNLYEINDSVERSRKRRKTCNERSSYITSIEGQAELQRKEVNSDQPMVGLNGNTDMEYDVQHIVSIKSHFRMKCDSIKKKFLAGYVSKLSQAQQEFRHSYMQVCDALGDQKTESRSWWLEALCHIEKNKEYSDQFIREIDDAVSQILNSSQQFGVSSRFRSISGMKYAIQTGLDLLESSRLALIERILEIDKTMEEPRDQDIAHMKYCQNCQEKGDGPSCIRCEMGNLCQEYELRLFFCQKEGNGGRGMVISAEEAMTLQKKSSTLNNFFTSLFHPNDDASSTIIGNEKKKAQRNGSASVRVQHSASELEILLSVLKTFSKGWLGKDALLAATKHIFLFE
ncbi:E3 ubiquitin-protein ligase shprh, partial [Thalictrum thalictroides]